MLPYISKSLDEVADELRDWVDGEVNDKLDVWYNKYKGKIDITDAIEKLVQKEVDKYKSTKEAYKKVSYKGIDSEYAKEIDSVFLDLQNKYPINEGNIEIKALNKKKVFGSSMGQIELKKNTLTYTDEIIISNANMQNAGLSDKLHILNYQGRGSKLRIGTATVDHEYAHAIDNYYILKKNKDMMDIAEDYRKGILFGGTRDQANLVNNFNKAISKGEDRLSYEMFEILKKEYSVGSDAAMNMIIRKELGEYATTSKCEFLAEGFANMRNLKEEDKTEFIKRFEELFNNKFDEVIRSGSN